MFDETEYKLKFYKCRNVKSPVKHGMAAGWDFFIPEDLKVKDFFNNTEQYINKNMYNLDISQTGFTIGVAFEIEYNKVIKTIAIQLNRFEHSDIIFFMEPNFVEITKKNNKEKHEKILNSPVKRILLGAQNKICIPSGIHVNLPRNVFLNAENKSGVASKRGLVKGACVVGDTDILTNKGLIKAEVLTKEYCEENNIKIKTMLSDGNYDYRKCDGFKVTNKAKVLTINFANGTTITGTYDHCIFLNQWYSLESIMLELSNSNSVIKSLIDSIDVSEDVEVNVYSTNVEETGNYVSKGNIVNKNCLIDADYQGEIHINLINTTEFVQAIEVGEKIIQFVPFFQPNMFEAEEFTSKEELYKDTESIRGEGGFGSSGTK